MSLCSDLKIKFKNAVRIEDAEICEEKYLIHELFLNQDTTGYMKTEDGFFYYDEVSIFHLS